jgi:signal transduction histidine kinase
VFTIGLIGYTACPAFVADGTLMASRRGRRPPAERAAVTLAYVGSLVVVGLAPALFFEPRPQGCTECATNLVAVTSAPGLVSAFQRAGVWFGVLWAATLVLVVMRRLVRTTSAARRVSAPLLVPLILYLTAVTSGYVHAVGDDKVIVDDTARRLWSVEALALAGLSLGFVAAAIRARRARQDVARALVALAEGPQPGKLRATLARTLDDPDLQVAYPLTDGRHVDDHGTGVEIVPAAGRAATAVIREGRTVAVLVHRSELLDDPRLVAEATNAAALALEHERLAAEAAAQLAELRDSLERLVAVTDHELQHLGRDLHDGAQQAVVALLVEVHLLCARIDGHDPDAATHLTAAEAELHRVLAEIRTLASNLHPAVLTDYGVVAAIGALGEQSPSPVNLRTMTGDRFPPDVEAAVYRAVVASARTGPVSIDLARHDGHVILDIDAAELPQDLGDVRDRVRALDGQLDVDAQPGAAHLRVVIPCA